MMLSNLLWVPSTNMVLLVNGVHIFYYHMNEFQSVVLGNNYFASHDYVVVKCWIQAVLLFLGHIVLARPFSHHFENIFLGVTGYSLEGLPFHCTVAILDLVSHFVVSAFPAH